MTLGGVATASPVAPNWVSEPEAATCVAAPATPVALNSSSASPEVAFNLFAPAVVPSVHEPTVATPFEPEVGVAPVIAPPPESTEKVTDTPPTTFPHSSTVFTLGLTETPAPTVPLSLPPLAARWWYEPAVAVAETVAVGPPVT